MHDRHLDALIDRFVAEYARAGGPALDPIEVLQHLEMYVLIASLYMTTAPPAILREIPDPSVVADQYDPLFAANETARVQMKVTRSMLNTWQRRDLGRHPWPDASCRIGQ